MIVIVSHWHLRAWSLVFALSLATVCRGQIVMYGLPLPVEASEVDSLVQRLDMSVVQAEAVRAMHQRYWDKWQSLFGESGPVCRRLLTRLNNFSREPKQPDDRTAVELLADFDAQVQRLRPVMQAMNEGLWGEVRTIVSPSDHAAVSRAALAHLRREQHRGLVAYRERNVDLAHLLDRPMRESRARLALDAPATQPDGAAGDLLFSEQEIVQLDEVMARYEQTLIQRLDGLIAGQQKAAPFLAQAADAYRSAQSAQHQPDADPKQIASINERAQSLQASAMRHVLEPSERIVEANRSALRQVVDVVRIEQRRRAIQEMYFAEAYPEVYPDPVDARTLFATAMEIGGLTEDQQAALAAMLSRFQSEHDRVSQQMMDVIYRRGQVTMGRGPDFVSEAAQLWGQLADFGSTREKLNESQLAMIRSVLTLEQAQQLPAWDFAKQQPPRRWLRGNATSSR